MRISDWSSDVCSSDLFDVLARRSDANGARDVTLPYFATVVRGGTAVVSKRVGQVNIHFADGEYRASASGTAQSYVDRGQATLPPDIQVGITREPRAGNPDAAVDPIPDPPVHQALGREARGEGQEMFSTCRTGGRQALKKKEKRHKNK